MFWQRTLAAVLAVAVAAGGESWGQDKPAPFKPPTHKVKRENLSQDLILLGEVEAVRALSVFSKVRAAAKDGLATTIRWVVEDGTMVKQGQTIVRLDDAALNDRLKAHKILVEQARNQLVQSVENVRIAQAQVESDVKMAEAAAVLAELDLEKYVQGDYEAQRLGLKRRLLRAESDVERGKDRVATAERDRKDGKISDRLLHAEVLRLDSAKAGLEMVRREIQVLEKYTFPRTRTELENRVKAARQTSDRTRIQAAARLTQARSSELAQKALLEQQTSQLQEIEIDLAACEIKAPADGMAVYYFPEASRGSKSAPLVAVGEPVREWQKLLVIWDLSEMQVRVRVPEALISGVRKEQPAGVQVHAFPERTLRGQVKQIATTADQSVWFREDLKVYQVRIALDEQSRRLRPGMTVEATLTTGKPPIANVLTVPSRSLVPPEEKGKPYQCFVSTPAGIERRQVVIGPTNGKMTAVTDGLREEEEVLLNPRPLLLRKQ